MLGYFVDKDQVGKAETAQDSERKDANDRKDMVLANAHQAWLAIAILIVLYPHLPIQFADLRGGNEIGLMIQLGMYASFLGTLAFWAVFCAIPIAYRICKCPPSMASDCHLDRALMERLELNSTL